MTSTDIISIIGTAAFAISGYLVGFRKRLDILGVVIVALLTAVGGGMIRDVLVGHIPRVFRENTALIVIFVTLFLSWLFNLQHQHRRALATWFIVADAIGLAAFSITGAQVGLALNLNLFGVITLGFVTAVGGGIVRDMLVNDVPIILRRDVYGSIAILMSALLYGLTLLNWVNAYSINILFAAGLLCRLWVHRYGIGLPGFQQKY
ncbi:trimeric intracellular cation channel family protein [Snodgrassella sp. CFCC 13594]|uniref:trimeric intracellular cation channel family protein n=1 Tax=Snodgrassella sp. CFCC 13594 TaxID=1775559 RepID=UPI00083675DB|nr:trimeric intracellular cation channel family protein [Snodgrassella sp. CFCC 13594]